MPSLHCTAPDFDKVFELTDGTEITIGRSPENTLTEGGQALSRRHAVITFSEGLCVLNDLNSSNGTFLNGDEVNRPQVLSAGDVVACGEMNMAYAD